MDKQPQKRGSVLVSVQDTHQEGEKHSHSEDEIHTFTEMFNYYFKDDAELKSVFPIETNQFFDCVKDGVVLCKLVNKAVPDTIFEKSINKKKPLNIFQEKENLNLAINSAASIGCVMVSITPPLIQEKREHIILGFVWQVVRIQTLSMINLKQHPYLARLKENEEELQDLLNLPPEVLLLRWFNYHLKNANHERRVANFSKDVKDGENYTILLNQLDQRCDKSALDKDPAERAKKIIKDSKMLEVPPFIFHTDITNGNPKLNMIFCAYLFNLCPGLVPTEEEKYAAAELIDDDVEGTREERSFRMWNNSLGIEGVYLNNLYNDIVDGIPLLKTLEKVEPGCVDWKKVEKNPSNKFKKLTNCNLAVNIGRDHMKFSLVGINGSDIHDGNKKLILAFYWQLIRKHTMHMIGDMKEEDLIKWGNDRAQEANRISNFKDKNISNCKFFFDILKSIEPRAINPELILEDDTDEAKEQNAKYVLSVARKLGATIFLVWEDIKDIKPKMLMIFVATLNYVVQNTKKE